jgi:8-oxo-dGTP pyrophosphatase MutT (NUDIX family)
VRAAVDAFDARSRREVVSRERFLAELDRLADPFRRGADPVHVTGSAIVAGRRGTVLHRHKTLGFWLQPGGHIDEGEAPWEAAVRETTEETGLTGRLGRTPEGEPLLFHLDVHPAGPHLHLDLRYLLYCDDAAPSPAAGESQEVRWFTLDEALAIADDGLVDGLRRLQALSPDLCRESALIRTLFPTNRPPPAP